MARITREKFKTYDGVFDNFTLRNLFELSSKGIFDELISPIALGKEANIFTASKGNDYVVIKIYRLETCDFNKMYEYLRRDSRYINISKNRRKTIFTWTQREYRNLMKAREAGLSVPTPYYFKDNILIEEFIGEVSEFPTPAPQIKNYMPRSKRRLYNDIISLIKKYYKAGYVHGDLSEFNILYKERAVFIDFSQAMPTKDDIDNEILKRDIRNIIRFFKKHISIKEDTETLLKRITED